MIKYIRGLGGGPVFWLTMMLVYAAETVVLVAMGTGFDDFSAALFFLLLFWMMLASGLIAAVKLHDRRAAK